MSNPYAFRRAAWLIEFLLEQGEAELKEIASAWKRNGLSDNQTIARQSWAKVISRIEDVFDIDIECQPKGSHHAKYFISNRHIFRGNSLAKWMIRCLHMKLQVLDCASIYDRILLEDFPSENGNFIPIKNAISQNVKICFDYTIYGKSEPKHHTVEPYCIKTYKYRYYVLGRFDSGRFCMFSFDRMSNISLTNERFEMEIGFDSESYFKQFFGVYVDDRIEVQRIVVRAYGDAGNYLLDVPLHHSQKILQTYENAVDFCFKLAPTNDFIGALLQQGNRFEVIAPPALRVDVIDRIGAMMSRYDVQS